MSAVRHGRFQFYAHREIGIVRGLYCEIVLRSKARGDGRVASVVKHRLLRIVSGLVAIVCRIVFNDERVQARLDYAHTSADAGSRYGMAC